MSSNGIALVLATDWRNIGSDLRKEGLWGLDGMGAGYKKKF
jgi:hypothetical protein